MRILSGIQANGRPHIGHYYGAIRQFIALEKQGEPFYFIADLHALTTVQDAKQLREHTRGIALAYLACGLDPARSTLFCQSEVPEHAELFWILGCLVPLSNLERAHSYKDKIAKGMKPDFGLFAYPVLMAADILLYSADHVPVGKDQVQHIEFARDWAIKFNLAFVPGYDAADPDGARTGAQGVLKIPEAFLKQEVATLPGIDGQKMSKSYGNAIDLFADDATVKKRIMSVKTDSTALEAPKPLESPLYSLLKALAPPSDFEAIDQSWRAGGKGYGEYKLKLLELFHAEFDPIRKKYDELARDPGEVDRVLSQGAERAREVAGELMGRVRKAVGFRV
jgi:tryptophanyl-tRNA synthetase